MALRSNLNEGQIYCLIKGGKPAALKEFRSAATLAAKATPPGDDTMSMVKAAASKNPAMLLLPPPARSTLPEKNPSPVSLMFTVATPAERNYPERVVASKTLGRSSS